MAGYTLANYKTALAARLGDAGNAVWSATELEYAYYAALSDISRLKPREYIYDVSIDFDVDDESFTTDDPVTTAVSLTYGMIKPESESVTSADGETSYTRDTDYTMDYANGIITPISGGDMAASTNYLISYTRLKIAVPISYSGLIRVKKIEYPAGQIPQDSPSYEIFADYLLIGSPVGDESQSQMSDNKHIWMYLELEHTPATADAVGTLPEYLDEVVLIGAEGYCLQQRSIELIEDAAALVVLGAANLTDGDDYITTVDVAANVPENYGQYSNYNNQLALTYLEAAQRYRVEALDRKEEFWSALRSKTQTGKQTSSSPPRQV